MEKTVILRVGAGRKLPASLCDSLLRKDTFAGVLISLLNDIFKTLHRNVIYDSMTQKALRKALCESSCLA